VGIIAACYALAAVKFKWFEILMLLFSVEWHKLLFEFNNTLFDGKCNAIQSELQKSSKTQQGVVGEMRGSGVSTRFTFECRIIRYYLPTNLRTRKCSTAFLFFIWVLKFHSREPCFLCFFFVFLLFGGEK
jgi:hypothetical protein